MGSRAIAQVRPDNTLGTESSRVTSPSPGAFQIDGGATRGANLFHSFSQFSVPTNGVAAFNNALSIQNIISRVTGGSVSNINGLIRAKGAANLFLINPNGIIFGPNARLNIGGSFVGSTANSLKFADGTQFSATAPQTTPLLTVSVPIGLQFGGTTPGSILNQSRGTDSNSELGRMTNKNIEIVGLQVQPGKTLALVGGDVSLDGGGLQAPGGRVELGGVSESGTVGLNVFGNNLRLSYPEQVQRADVSLANKSSVYVFAGSGGSIAINARNLDISGKSQVGINTGRDLVGAQAGDIEIDATGTVRLLNSYIFNTVDPRSTGKAGNIKITTGSLSLTNDSQLNAATYGQGNAGNISIMAGGTVSFDGSTVFTRVSPIRETEGGPAPVGKGGDIYIWAGSVSLTGGSELLAETSSKGDAGNITVNARDRISVDGSNGKTAPSAISPSCQEGCIGNSGNILLSVKAGSVSFTNSGKVFAITLGTGNAGNVTIVASDRVSFDGVVSNSQAGYSSAYTWVGDRGVGNGGDISIKAGSVFLTNGAQVNAVTAGRGGNAGNIQVHAANSVTISGSTADGRSSGLFTSSQQGASEQGSSGQGGEITVNTNDLLLQNGAVVDAQTLSSSKGGSVTINANTFEAAAGGQILTTTSSSGNAGNIRLNVIDSVKLSGSDPTYADRVNQFGGTVSVFGHIFVNQSAASGLFANTASGSTGSGGSIAIDPTQLTLTDGAGIFVNSLGSGPGGNLSIHTGSLTLDNGSRLLATSNSASGGNLDLTVPSLLLMRHNSNISANAGSAGGGGNGGNITINTPFLVAVPSENSDITANAATGNGGKVIINASGIFGTESRQQSTPESDITALSTGGGLNGTVSTNTPQVDPSRGLVTLPVMPVNVSGLIAQGCPAEVGPRASKFVITGRGGLPPNPSQPLGDDAVLTNWATLNPRVEHSPSSADSIKPTSAAPTPIVPATGWVFNGKGEVTLTASAPTESLQIPWITPTTCHAQ
jgi:filamentous hemagglutinin family protein